MQTSGGMEDFVVLAGFLWKQRLRGSLGSRWAVAPLVITFGPIASSVVNYLNL